MLYIEKRLFQELLTSDLGNEYCFVVKLRNTYLF